MNAAHWTATTMGAELGVAIYTTLANKALAGTGWGARSRMPQKTAKTGQTQI